MVIDRIRTYGVCREPYTILKRLVSETTSAFWRDRSVQSLNCGYEIEDEGSAPKDKRILMMNKIRYSTT